LDFLKFVDRSTVKINEAGEVTGAAEVVEALRKAKGYVFESASTSSSHNPPPVGKLKTKHATDMTPEEYAKSKAALIRENRLSAYR
jgi:hypothetical protein